MRKMASVQTAVDQANKLRSAITPAVQAEGIVWHRLDGRIVPPLDRACFKAINNSWLLKHEG